MAGRALSTLLPLQSFWRFIFRRSLPSTASVRWTLLCWVSRGSGLTPSEGGWACPPAVHTVAWRGVHDLAPQGTPLRLWL